MAASEDNSLSFCLTARGPTSDREDGTLCSSDIGCHEMRKQLDLGQITMRVCSRVKLERGAKSTLTLVAYQRQPGIEAIWSRLLHGQARVLSHDKPATSRNRASRLAKGSHLQEDLPVQLPGPHLPNFAQ